MFSLILRRVHMREAWRRACHNTITPVQQSEASFEKLHKFVMKLVKANYPKCIGHRRDDGK